MNELRPDKQSAHERTPPGQQLRGAREARNLTPEAVARELHLSIATIKALEADDYGKLPHPTFVRGYLRNYARLLGLSESEILAAYSVDPAGIGLGSPPDPLLARRDGTRFNPLFIFVPVAALACLGWWIRHAELEESASQTPAPVMAEAEPASNEIDEPRPDSPPSETSSPAPVPSVPAMTGNPTAPPTATPAPTTPAAEPAPADTSPVPDSLVFHFTGDSWVTVVDAQGKRLLYETGAQGTAKTVQGTPPYKVTLGRPMNVRVELDGQPFTHPSMNRDTPVRLRIGTAPAAGPRTP